jgi:drug/metabolite transporter (DMT)-like permease
MKRLAIFSAILFSVMLGTIIWASSHSSIRNIPQSVLSNPWFITTLVDVYIGFLLFYAWVWYRESSYVKRAVWFVLIIGLGNLATCIYILWIIWTLPEQASMEDFLLGSQKSPTVE